MTNCWLPVRCCCTPTKVFGFLRLRDDEARAPLVRLTDREGKTHEIKIRKFAECVKPSIERMFDPDLEVINFRHSLPAEELAVYSDDRPVEFWQRFAGFIPAGAS